jgi:hypothetical protein
MYQIDLACRMTAPAPPAQVFPLLCPVREHDWIDGWSAEVLFSRTGVAELGCVFRTATATWVVHHYEPPSRIGFTVHHGADLVELLTIELDGDGTSTLEWRRKLTALDPGRVADVERRAAGFVTRHAWIEQALAHYLATGDKLPAEAC